MAAPSHCKTVTLLLNHISWEFARVRYSWMFRLSSYTAMFGVRLLLRFPFAQIFSHYLSWPSILQWWFKSCWWRVFLCLLFSHNGNLLKLIQRPFWLACQIKPQPDFALRFVFGLLNLALFLDKLHVTEQAFPALCAFTNMCLLHVKTSYWMLIIP